MIRQRNHELKLDRAIRHWQSFNEEVDAWLESEPYCLIHESDIRSGETLLLVELLRPAPPELASIIGDCLHNLRSALDNLAYELAVAHTGEPLPKSIEGDSGFPILFRDRDTKEPAKRVKRMIRGIHPKAQMIIEELQPHYPDDKEFSAHPLSVLNELSNKDKHRFPHLGIVSTQSISVIISPAKPEFANVKFSHGVVEGRKEIARYSVPPGGFAEVSPAQPLM